METNKDIEFLINFIVYICGLSHDVMGYVDSKMDTVVNQINISVISHSYIFFFCDKSSLNLFT